MKRTIIFFLTALIFNTSLDAFAHPIEDLDFYTVFKEHGTTMLLINADTGEIEHANMAAAKFYGYSIEKLESMNINEINMIEQKEIDRRIEISIKEQLSNFMVEQRLSNGEIRTVQVYVCPHVAGDKTIIFATIFDITDRILLERKNRLIYNTLLFMMLGIVFVVGLFIYVLYKDMKKLKVQSQEISNLNELRSTYIDADKNLVYLKDENFKYVFVNKALLNFFSKTAEEVIGYDVFHIAEVGYANKSMKMCTKVLDYKDVIEDKIHWKGKIYQATKFPVKLLNGHYGVGAYIKDITEEYMNKRNLEKMNMAYNKSNTLLNAILEGTPEIIVFALDTNYCYLSYNNRHKEVMRTIWGKEIEIGMSMLKVIGAHEDNIKAKENFDKALSGHSFTLTEEYGDENLSRLVWQNYYAPIYDGEKIFGLTCFVLNITDRKKAEEEVIYLSYHDELTGLYNRRFFEEELKRIDTEGNLPISIISGDVNGLKLTNDIFGHASGDELLRKIAEVLKKVCRQDDIIARIGGDEFLILLPKTNEKQAQEIILRVKNRFSKESVKAINGSISMGCSIKKYASEDLRAVLQSAEDKMYSAKIIDREDVKDNTIINIIDNLHSICTKEKSHSENVSLISEKMGKVMNLPEVEIRALKDAGYYHDIGKVVLNYSILKENSNLNELEQKEMNQHPIIGYRILNSFDHTLGLAELVLAHHENWDGSGHPKGLKGKEIPKLARIISVANSYDAMVSKEGQNMTSEEAINELKKQANIKFDPSIIDIFISNICDIWTCL